MESEDLPNEMPNEMPDEWATLWQLIRRVAGSMDRQGEALFRRELGISLAQFLVLSVVDAYPGPLSQQAVADRLGLTKGTVSRQIEAAVSAGLMTVQVAAHTRRENAVSLTKAGATLVRAGDDLVKHSRAPMLKAIDPTQFPAVVATLQAMLAELEP
ncbi:MAG: MarR family transcriptional regulator [Humibacillus sp.]|nr:MarR family transcriptional regulator [Humibacillus sp.]MDN5777716.1 MarR family transcriptional regulator [Humibacillus sp.]